MQIALLIGYNTIGVRIMYIISKRDVRELVSLIMPIVIGILVAISDSTYEKKPVVGAFLWMITGLALLCFIGYWIKTKKYITNENRVLEEQEKQIVAYQEILSGFISDFILFSKEVNTLIHEIEGKGEINLNIWNFDKASGEVCGQAYNALCKIADERKFGVNYIRLIEDENEDSIMMTGSANWNSTGEKIFQTIRKFKGTNPDGFHDSKLFLKNSADIDILIDETEIKKEFELYDKNIDKYSQYIGIPVFCDGTKMVGLLEIVCVDGGKLSDTREGVLEITNKYLIPYAYFLLFLHKLEKALLAHPTIEPPKSKWLPFLKERMEWK